MAAATAANVNGLSGDAASASSTPPAPTVPSPSGTNGSESNGNGAVSTKRKRDNDGDEVMADAGLAQPAAATASPATAIDQIKAAASASSSPALSSKSVNGKVETAINGHNTTSGPVTSTTAGNRDEKRLIRDYFDVLKTFDKSVPPILSRPLPESPATDEPQAKRQKPDGTTSPPAKAAKSVSERVENDGYALLDDLVLDIATVIRSELAALETAATHVGSEDKIEGQDASEAKEETDTTNAADAKGDGAVADDDKKTGTSDKKAEHAKRAAIEHITKFRETAYDLYRRETAYPKSGPLHGKTGGKIGNDASVSISSSNRGEPVLTVFGNAPGPRQLFSSLPSRGQAIGGKAQGEGDDGDEEIDDVVREDVDISFGGNMTLTRVFAPPPPDKNTRAPTFGELFPSPRNLPPLQPPKAPKSTTKSTTLGFYHPELSERSKYRTGSYSTQQITTGQWLDYSNATPSSQIKTRQRERAQSLAGRKPSATELELSEMESLFRGAFSSFAPSRDDSAAIVSSTHVGRMWWQRVGHRIFQRMAEKELGDEEQYIEEASTPNDVATADVLDEEALKKTIAEWDDSLVDPSLEEVMGEKTDYEKDVDEMLQEVSDLVITLASYQRNRNLTLPTSQDRFSADPVNADMLRNGTLAQQPSEEEMLTYQTLKAQLSLIIQALPPYAVARLNSDKLEELNISTKIEVRGEEYRGILEEDESVVRARQAAQAAQAGVSSPQRAPAHRAASISANHNYGPQFNTPSRTPMASGGAFFPGQHQTPARAGPPHRASVGGAAGAPAAALPPHVRPGTQAQPSFRPSPNGYANYGPMAKAQQQMQVRQGMQHLPPGQGFAPGQQVSPHMSPQRVVSQPQPGSYGSPGMQPGTPQQFRYPPGTPGFPQQVPLPPAPTPGTPQHQQQQLQQQQLQQQQMHQQQRRASHSMQYPPSPANGVAQMAPQQHPIHPPQHVGSPQQRFQQGPMTPGNPQQQQQQQQQQHIRQQQQLMARPPLPGQIPVQQQQLLQQQQQRQFGGQPGGPPVGAGPFGYHTVMDQPQQQRLMEQARARASAHERNMGFGDKINPGGVGQVAGLAGIGLGGGGVDMSKLAAARANMPSGGSNMPRPGQYQPQPSPSPQPQFQSPVPPQAYLQHPQQQQQQQQSPRPQGQPSPMMNGTPQPHHVPSPSPVSMSVSPAPSAGFQRPS